MKVINSKSWEKEKLNWPTDSMDKNYVKKDSYKEYPWGATINCI